MLHNWTFDVFECFLNGTETTKIYKNRGEKKNAGRFFFIFFFFGRTSKKQTPRLARHLVLLNAQLLRNDVRNLGHGVIRGGRLANSNRLLSQFFGRPTERTIRKKYQQVLRTYGKISMKIPTKHSI